MKAMDERKKSMFEAGELLLSERLLNNIAAIERTYRESPEEYAAAFSDAIQVLLARVALAQAQSDKGPLRYIYVSFLQSSLYTGNYEICIDAYDERLFGDLTDTHAYWSPDFIFRYIKDDMAHFRKHIGQHVLRVREHEIMAFFAQYVQHYYRIVQTLVTELIEPIVAAETSDTRELTVIFGEYMEQGVVLSETGQVG